MVMAQWLISISGPPVQALEHESQIITEDLTRGGNSSSLARTLALPAATLNPLTSHPDRAVSPEPKLRLMSQSASDYGVNPD